MTAVQFFFFMNLFYTYTTDFAAWYAGGTIFALVTGAGFAVYGFHTALAGQPLLRGERLD